MIGYLVSFALGAVFVLAIAAFLRRRGYLSIAFNPPTVK